MNPRAIKELMPNLRFSKDRRLATCLLADIGDPRDPDVIRAMLERVRGDGLDSCAASTLAEAGPAARLAVPVLESMLDGSEVQRVNAARLLASIQRDHSRIVPTLRPLLASSTRGVAIRAALQLAKLGQTDRALVAVTIPALAKKLPPSSVDYDSREDEREMRHRNRPRSVASSSSSRIAPAILQFPFFDQGWPASAKDS